MPLLLLGVIVAGAAALYMYLVNNKEKLVKKDDPKKDPFSAAYLPVDIEDFDNGTETEDTNQ